jgi:hypothetical protein
LSVTEHEAAQVERANAFTSAPVVVPKAIVKQVAQTALDFIKKHT